MSRMKKFLGLALVALPLMGALLLPTVVRAEEAAAAAPDLAAKVAALESQAAAAKVGADTIWVLVTAFLVFWMNAGFALVESGMCRAKNAVNILSKNFIVFACSSLAYYFLGWGMMFGDGNGFIGLKGLWMVSGMDNSPATGAAYQGVYSAINWTGVPLGVKFLFQLVFAGTAATIVSGCVAERIKYVSFIVFSFLLVGIAYPISGHWIWGGGWLAAKGFADFAGSTVVHTVGGVAGLAGILLLGPRLGKYRPDGSVNAIPGHNMTSATLGTLILWLGWFGFNPGSTMAVDAFAMGHIANTTNLAGATGLLTATATAWILMGKPDLGMTINGCLAGFVAITAPCAWVSQPASIVIGGIAGVLVVFAVVFFDKMKWDDPVGALAVHLCNGIFGTLAVGLWGDDKYVALPAGATKGLFNGGGTHPMVTQLTGSASVILFTLVLSLVFWAVIKATMGMRVSREEEINGLDIGEHGMEAYAGFQITAAEYALMPAGGNGSSDKPKEKELAKAGR
jgi:ammonium transporter, Amt family